MRLVHGCDEGALLGSGAGCSAMPPQRARHRHATGLLSGLSGRLKTALLGAQDYLIAVFGQRSSPERGWGAAWARRLAVRPPAATIWATRGSAAPRDLRVGRRVSKLRSVGPQARD